MFLDLLNVNPLCRRSVDGESLSHCFAHVDGPCDVVATLLNDIVLFDSDLLDLSVDGFRDRLDESLIPNRSVRVRRADFVLDGDECFVASFDLREKRLPIHLPKAEKKKKRRRERWIQEKSGTVEKHAAGHSFESPCV